MGRLLYAVAASAVFCSPAAAEHADPKAVIRGDLDPALRAEIERVVGDSDKPIDNRFEARRRARAAAEDAIAVLRSEGYYAYAVVPDVSEADPPEPLVQITPGRRFMLGEAGIAWQGETPDLKAEAAARSAMALTPGAPGRASEVLAAEGRIVAAMQSRGYADVVSEPREVIVDHADFTVRPTYRIAAGRLVRLDGLDITAGGRTDPAWVRRLAPWTSGETYDPTDVGELERRLLDTGVYDGVTVALAPPEKATPEGLRPVVVSLSERKGRSIEAGANYDTEDGVGVNARWIHYNRLHRADTITLFGQASTRDSRVGAELSLPHWRRPRQTFKTRGQVYRVRTDAYDEEGVGLEADITRRYGKISNFYGGSYFTLGASVDLTHTQEYEEAEETAVISTLGRDLITLGTLGDLLFDRSNDPLDPTTGWRLSARAEPTLILGDTNLPYLRLVTQGTYYLPITKEAKTVLAARLRLGRIVNGSVDQIPASQRFYAGGGGSVRGFGYQDVGPRIDADTPQGGTSLFESSFEVRQSLTPKWGFAAFVDAGSVGSGGAIDLDDLAVGVGLGVRYNLGFAPIRVDVATPVMNRKGGAAFQLYVSIGQSF